MQHCFEIQTTNLLENQLASRYLASQSTFTCTPQGASQSAKQPGIPLRTSLYVSVSVRCLNEEKKIFEGSKE